MFIHACIFLIYFLPSVCFLVDFLFVSISNRPFLNLFDTFTLYFSSASQTLTGSIQFPIFFPNPYIINTTATPLHYLFYFFKIINVSFISSFLFIACQLPIQLTLPFSQFLKLKEQHNKRSHLLNQNPPQKNNQHFDTYWKQPNISNKEIITKHYFTFPPFPNFFMFYPSTCSFRTIDFSFLWIIPQPQEKPMHIHI